MVKKLELRLFGNAEFYLGGVPVDDFKSSKSQALLIYLAVTGKPHNRSTLAGLLWGGMPEDRARMNLSQSLTTLRRFFAEHLVIDRRMVGIRQDRYFWSDVADFSSRATGSVMKTNDPSAIHTLEEAVQTYRGDFLDGFEIPKAPEFETWMMTERTRLRELALAAIYKVACYYDAQGETGRSAATDYTSQLLSLEPWHEEGHRMMMRLLSLSGRRSAALAQYEQFRSVLSDELGVEPEQATRTLYERIRDGDFARTPRRNKLPVRQSRTKAHSSSSQETTFEREIPRTNLQPQLTRFVGRARELDEIEDLFIKRGSRLVTIVGPGGIGKTRLALEFASRQLDTRLPSTQGISSSSIHFPNGVFFVSLESISSAEMIWTAIADAMRLRLDHGETQLIGYLRSKRLLLVLDNLEHLLTGVEKLAGIIQSAPQIRCLVTSRQQLGLLEEQVYPLQGLSYPEYTKAEDISDYSAAKLFIQTAQRLRPSFALGATENETLARICQQVEGMPLALELAACWTDTLSLSSIANEIQGNSDFLKASYRNMPARHHSLRAVFDVSWARLLPAERTIFSKLYIFRGGFTREAASQITAAKPEHLAALVRKSMLRYSKSQDRFSIHELLRQYGEQKLFDQSVDVKELKDRHSQYYCTWFADQVDPSTLISKGQKAVLDGMSAELENARAAWDWALQNQELERLLGVKTALGLYYAWRGGFQEGERTFQSHDSQLVDSKSKQTTDCMLLRADLLNWRAYFLNELGDRPKAINLLLESQDLISTLQSMEMDIRGLQAHNLVNKSRAGWWQTSDDRKAQMEQALALYREGTSVYGLPYTLYTSANMALVTGQAGKAHRFFEESLKIYERTGNLLGKAAVLNGLGHLSFAKNDYVEAENFLQQAMHIAGEIEDRQREANISMSLGCVLLYAGQFEQAHKSLEISAVAHTELGLKNRRAAALCYLGYTHLHLGEYDQAIRYGETALLLAKETDYKEIIAQSLMLPAAIALTKGDFVGALQGFKSARKEFVSKRFTRILYGEDCGQLGLGAATLLLGRIDEALNILKDLLQQAVASHRQDLLLYALVGFAVFFVNQGNNELALELDALVRSYPFVGRSRWFADTFGRLIELASSDLPLDKVEAAKMKGESQVLWDVADELTLEFNIQLD